MSHQSNWFHIGSNCGTLDHQMGCGRVRVVPFGQLNSATIRSIVSSVRSVPFRSSVAFGRQKAGILIMSSCSFIIDPVDVLLPRSS